MLAKLTGVLCPALDPCSCAAVSGMVLARFVPYIMFQLYVALLLALLLLVVFDSSVVMELKSNSLCECHRQSFDVVGL